MLSRLAKSGALLFMAGLFALQATAQSSRETPSGTKDENIIIHKKGNSNEKLTIVVDGDQITVNGKPVDEFKGKNIEISRNKNTYRFTGPEMPMGPGGPRIMRDDILRNFNSNKAFLGVASEKADTGDGAKIAQITQDSPADKAGLKKGDIITKIGDTKITDSQSLFDAVGQYKPDDKIAITYKRDGKEAVVNATLEKNKQVREFHFNNDDFNFSLPDLNKIEGFRYSSRARVGLQVQDMESGKGVKVLGVTENTPADKAGLKKDDVITGVNGKDISSVDELREATQDLKEGSSLQLNYSRNNQSQTAEIKIPKRLKTSNL